MTAEQPGGSELKPITPARVAQELTKLSGDKRRDAFNPMLMTCGSPRSSMSFASAGSMVAVPRSSRR